MKQCACTLNCLLVFFGFVFAFVCLAGVCLLVLQVDLFVCLL